MKKSRDKTRFFSDQYSYLKTKSPAQCKDLMSSSTDEGMLLSHKMLVGPQVSFQRKHVPFLSLMEYSKMVNGVFCYSTLDLLANKVLVVLFQNQIWLYGHAYISVLLLCLSVSRHVIFIYAPYDLDDSFNLSSPMFRCPVSCCSRCN